MLIIILSILHGNIQETSLLYRNQEMKNQMTKSGMILFLFMFLIILMNSICKPKFFHFLGWAFVHRNSLLGCVLVIAQKALVHFERKT